MVDVGPHEPAVGEDDVDGEEVVQAEAVAAAEVADPPAQSEAADPGAGDDAGRRGQPERVGRVVERAQLRSALDGRRGGERVDTHTVHRGEVEDEARTRAQPGTIVPAAADRDLDAGGAREVDPGDHVCDVAALDDEGRPYIDHAVVDGAGRVVVGVTRPHQRSAQSRREGVDRGFVQV